MVAGLAARWSIQVHLRPSAYGGITAVVLVPPELVVIGADEPVTHPEPASRPDALEPPKLADTPRGVPDESPDRRSASLAAPGGGLPQRIPRSNLAPQLTDPKHVPGADVSTALPVRRVPERERATLAAFQAGASRARHQPIENSDAPLSARRPDRDEAVDA
jgi:hypothetical protein